MSVIVPFPGGRAGSRGGQHNRSGRAPGAVPATHTALISWVHRASCECCGRPTLGCRGGAERLILCDKCSPPSVA
jgi:hypothetical protein